MIKIMLAILGITIVGCSNTPSMPEDDTCIQVYKDEDGTMKYKNVSCVGLLRKYQDVTK